MRLDNPSKGILFALLAPFFYALKSAVVKFALPIKIEQLLFLRLLFDAIILSPLFFKARKQLASNRLRLHFFRAALVTLLSYASVYGIRKLALVDIVLLESSFPLFIPLVLWIWHRKTITRQAWVILFLGFMTLFFLTKPSFDFGYLASVAGLSIAFLSAVTLVSVSTLSTTESSVSILFYYYLFSGLLVSIFCIYTWDGMPVVPSQLWWPFILHSLFGVFFQYSVVRAYGLIASHFVGGFSYFGILFSALFGWVIWNEPLDTIQIIGAILLIGLGILMIRERGRKSFVENG